MTKLPEKSLYFKVAELLREKSRRMAPGDKLPDYRELARRYDCSLYTVQRAVRILSEEGLFRLVQGSGAYLQGLNARRPQVLITFPLWNKRTDGSFAELAIRGARSKIADYDWNPQECAYFYKAPEGEIVDLLADGRFVGVVWVNCYCRATVNYLIGLGVKVVCTHAWSDECRAPTTRDDVEAQLPNLVAEFKARNVRTLAVLGHGANDAPYAHWENRFLEACRVAGIYVDPTHVLHLHNQTISKHEKLILMKDFIQKTRDVDAYWAFSPNSIEELQPLWSSSKRISDEKVVGLFDIHTWNLQGAQIVLDSDIDAHCRAAIDLLKEWTDTGKKPADPLIPMRIRTGRLG